jgi:hypothetical protein
LRIIWVLAVLTGCAGPAPDHEEEAHAVPAHHPRTFRRAVADIGRRGAVLTAGGLDDESRELQRRQLLDIVRWLPELAADTELGRLAWERVNGAASSLANGLESFASPGEQGGDRAALSAVMEEALRTLAAVDASLPSDIPEGEAT